MLDSITNPTNQMTDIKRIKDTAAREFDYVDYAEFDKLLKSSNVELIMGKKKIPFNQPEKFIDRCIELASEKERERILAADPYANDLNGERIKACKRLAELYTISESSVRGIFCQGVDWYRKKLQSIIANK